MTRLADGPVLVTGGSGFVGTHLCPRLVDHGVEVHATSRHAGPATAAAVRWHRLDATDPEAVRSLVAAVQPATIFHLAGSVSASRELSNVLPALQSNTVATINVLSAATESGCGRVVVIPSLEEPVVGGDDAVPPSPYAASKWAAGGYARMFHALYGTPVVGARIMMMYGPHQSEAKLVPYVVRSLLRGEAPSIGSPDRAVDWVYATDVADGLVAAATAPGVEGDTVDLGSGTLVTIRDLVSRLTSLVDPSVAPQPHPAATRPLEPVRAARADVTHDKLGWRATTSLDDGLAATVAWHRRQDDGPGS